MKWKIKEWTSHIDHTKQKKLGVTLNEYVVAQFIFHMASNKEYDGWCQISNANKAFLFDIDIRNIIRIKKKLHDKDLIVVMKNGNSNTTPKWNRIYSLNEDPIHIMQSDETPCHDENAIHIVGCDETPCQNDEMIENNPTMAKRHTNHGETSCLTMAKRHTNHGETSHMEIYKLSIGVKGNEQAKSPEPFFEKNENEEQGSSAPPPPIKKNRDYKNCTNRISQIYDEEFQLAQGFKPLNQAADSADLQTLISKIKENMKLENEVVTEQSVELQFRGFLRGVAADQFMKDTYFSPEKLKTNYQIILTKIRNANNNSKSTKPDKFAERDAVFANYSFERFGKNIYTD